MASPDHRHRQDPRSLKGISRRNQTGCPISAHAFCEQMWDSDNQRRTNMNPLTNLITGLKSLFNKKRVDHDLEDELESYLEASAAHKQQSGLSPSAARRAARAEIGSRNSVKHQVWSSRWESVLENLFQDLRFAI